MTTSTDTVRWSVVAPIIIGSVMALMVTIGTILYAAGGVSRSVESLGGDMGSIKDQMRVQASALTHLDDEFHFGATRMDAQDRELAEIKAQIASLKEQVIQPRPVPIRGRE